MPFIALVEKQPKSALSRLNLVKLYYDLFQTGLAEAGDQVDSMIHSEGRYMIPVAEADVSKAAHFVYQAREFGIVCQLRSTSSETLC